MSFPGGVWTLGWSEEAAMVIYMVVFIFFPKSTPYHPTADRPLHVGRVQVHIRGQELRQCALGHF